MYIVRIEYPLDGLPPRLLTFHSFKWALYTFRALAPFASHITLEGA